MTERTWAGTHTFAAAEVLRPTTIDEARRLVSRHRRIRSVGTRHSFNDLADTAGALLDLTGVDPDIVVDESGRTVTVGAGTRYAVVARHLADRGWALHNMGSLPHISVGGATATSTHGSGDRNGSLATAVRALEFIAPDGSLRRVAAGDPDFAGSVVHLGALGPVTRVTLAIEPTYRVRQDTYVGLTWDDLLGRFEEVTAAGYSVSVFTRWNTDDVGELWVKERLGPDSPSEMPERVLSARRVRTKADSPAADGVDNTTEQGGVPGDWCDRLPHFRIDATPSNGDEIQTEYWVARASAVEAVAAVRTIAERVEPALLVSELRTVAADELWLSPGCGRDSVCIHFTWKNEPDAVAAAIRAVEEAIAPFDPRPHWGKVFSMPIGRSLPRLDDVRGLVARTDPDGKFTGPYLERVLGI
ncbi:FAD-binding protein [Microbacterium radiodurans]|uniref:FAD-binding protein n=1 Tax=Microbacterium radiodurans TaxID=661398 RepID=A0A5J5IUP6_9MICO|nr:FAD-binding protein [Microbacterium radiodurans]KAA9089753.1 FAD-binding protein [Microbacterium radiodurans]